VLEFYYKFVYTSNDFNIFQLAVITPCFNPPKSWVENYIHSCKSIENLLNIADIAWILVNDGSLQSIDQDSISQIQQSLKNFSYFPLVKNQGKGFATRYGVQQVEAAAYIYTDIDFPYKNEDFVKVYQAVAKGNDLVIAVRSAQYYEQISKSRTWISQRFKSIVKLLFKIPTTDTQAGLKGLSRAGREVLLQTTVNQYLFDLELVKLAAKKDLRIKEVSVKLKEGITLTDVSYKILFTELLNLFKILFS
jgi:hypothetical protein